MTSRDIVNIIKTRMKMEGKECLTAEEALEYVIHALKSAMLQLEDVKLINFMSLYPYARKVPLRNKLRVGYKVRLSRFFREDLQSAFDAMPDDAFNKARIKYRRLKAKGDL